MTRVSARPARSKSLPREIADRHGASSLDGYQPAPRMPLVNCRCRAAFTSAESAPPRTSGRAPHRRFARVSAVARQVAGSRCVGVPGSTQTVTLGPMGEVERVGDPVDHVEHVRHIEGVDQGGLIEAGGPGGRQLGAWNQVRVAGQRLKHVLRRGRLRAVAAVLPGVVDDRPQRQPGDLGVRPDAEAAPIRTGNHRGEELPFAHRQHRITSKHLLGQGQERRPEEGGSA